MTERPTDYDYAATYGDSSIWDEYRSASSIPIEEDPISLVVRDFVELCQNMLGIANRIRVLHDEAKLGYGNNFAGDIFKKMSCVILLVNTVN